MVDIPVLFPPRCPLHMQCWAAIIIMRWVSSSQTSRNDCRRPRNKRGSKKPPEYSASGGPSVVLAGVDDVPAAILAVPAHRGITQFAQGLQDVAVDGRVPVFVGVDPLVAEDLRNAWHEGFLVDSLLFVDRIKDPLGNFWCIGHLLRIRVHWTHHTTRPSGESSSPPAHSRNAPGVSGGAGGRRVPMPGDMLDRFCRWPSCLPDRKA